MANANTSAGAVNTIVWLSTEAVTLVVPVYQRHYRWEIEACERLLADVRAVAGGQADRTHFFGSILHTVTRSGAATEWMLVDGQQRVTTVMLLLAAIRDALSASAQTPPAELDRAMLLRAGEGVKLRLRDEGALELDRIVNGAPLRQAPVEGSHVWDNYDFFRERVRDDALTVWTGVQRLEHVAITLGEYANAQQVFESLNSTGTPLRDHELIHNHILMGLTDSQQTEIEEAFWIPIEANTGEEIDDFWRDYLILKTGRDSQFAGDRGVYGVFKAEFPEPTFQSLATQAEQWRSYSEVYRLLLEPSLAGDDEISRHLGYVNTFGTATYPLLLGVYRDYQLDEIDRDTLLQILEQLQSLYLRKTVVGESRDHLAAQLCRKRRQYGYPIDAIAQRMPSDERISEALTYRALPLANYVLRRIQEPGDLGDLQVEHIFPQLPADIWNDGNREWHTFTETERAKYREVLSTIGNLILLEAPLNAAAGNRSFPDKKGIYADSEVPAVLELAEPTGPQAWDLDTIAARTRQLSIRFLEIWQRPSRVGSDESDHLVPILDVQKRPGYYKGWKTEFDYVRFRGDHWEVHDLKTLFRRVFTLLWGTHRPELLAYSAAHDGPVFETQEWKSHWQPLPGSHYLFMGWFPQYMLGAIQEILDDLDMADDLLVKYSTDDD